MNDPQSRDTRTSVTMYKLLRVAECRPLIVDGINKIEGEERLFMPVGHLLAAVYLSTHHFTSPYPRSG